MTEQTKKRNFASFLADRMSQMSIEDQQKPGFIRILGTVITKFNLVAAA